MTLNKRVDYGDFEIGQANKDESLRKATGFVKEIMDEISPLLDSCEYYDSEIKLGGAPAVKLPSEEVVIAPDIRCRTKEGKVFWLEAKDKSQRFFYPDTGADIFQVYGWYKIWQELEQPVFVVFKDPDYDSCLPRGYVDPDFIESFKKRWDTFEGKPYGAWLSELLVVENNYPRILFEKSREKSMYIFYFRIELMKANLNWNNIIDEVNNNKVPNIQPLQAYYKTLLTEKEIKAKIDSLFKS
jgi:hypothetical protein